MQNRNLPALFLIASMVLYTIWFFYDFPTRQKEPIAKLLTASDSAKISFYSSGGSNVVVHVNEARELSRLSEAFEKSPLISIPNTKRVIFGYAVFSTRGNEVLRMNFCSSPVVLINGSSYAVSPDFTMLVWSLTEERREYE